jgi:hypothetical protein
MACRSVAEKKGLAINCYFWQSKRVYGLEFIVYCCELSQNAEPNPKPKTINEKQIHIWNNLHYWLNENEQVLHG